MSVAPDPEHDLMLRVQRGDRAAFEALYRLVRDRVYRLCHRLLGDPEAAAEAAQEVLVKVYRAREGYRDDARFSTWLHRVTVNHCLNERSRAWRRREQATEAGVAGLDRAGPVALDPDRATEGAALGRAIEAALAALPPNQRAAVVLARYEGLSMEEIADALDLPGAGAAKMLLHRARARLQLALSPHLTEAS